MKLNGCATLTSEEDEPSSIRSGSGEIERNNVLLGRHRAGSSVSGQRFIVKNTFIECPDEDLDGPETQHVKSCPVNEVPYVRPESLKMQAAVTDPAADAPSFSTTRYQDLQQKSVMYVDPKDITNKFGLPYEDSIPPGSPNSASAQSVRTMSGKTSQFGLPEGSSKKVTIKKTFFHIDVDIDDCPKMVVSKSMPSWSYDNNVQESSEVSRALSRRATTDATSMGNYTTEQAIRRKQSANGEVLITKLADREPEDSLGSENHPDDCRPCAWFWKSQGCHNGRNCRHCHLCQEGSVKARRKMKSQMSRQRRVVDV